MRTNNRPTLSAVVALLVIFSLVVGGLLALASLFFAPADPVEQTPSTVVGRLG